MRKARVVDRYGHIDIKTVFDGLIGTNEVTDLQGKKYKKDNMFDDYVEIEDELKKQK